MKYGGLASSIGGLEHKGITAKSQFQVRGGNLSFSGAATSVDNISVYSIHGRLLQSISGNREVSLDGISRGQTLLVVASKAGKVILTTKMIVQ